MTLIAWNDDFAVGIPAVDQEHQDLIQRINNAYGTLLRQDGFQVSAIEFLSSIYHDISAHFAREEKLMVDFHYDHYFEHKSDHQHLLDDLADIQFNVQTQNYYDQDILRIHFNAWFGTHFITKDHLLHQYLGSLETHDPGNNQNT